MQTKYIIYSLRFLALIIFLTGMAVLIYIPDTNASSHISPFNYQYIHLDAKTVVDKNSIIAIQKSDNDTVRLILNEGTHLYIEDTYQGTLITLGIK